MQPASDELSAEPKRCMLAIHKIDMLREGDAPHRDKIQRVRRIPETSTGAATLTIEESVVHATSTQTPATTLRLTTLVLWSSC